ncbi:hypothetical protein JCM10207_005664 [Rhodosporidiobolus poonsookiae]
MGDSRDSPPAPPPVPPPPRRTYAAASSQPKQSPPPPPVPPKHPSLQSPTSAVHNQAPVAASSFFGSSSDSTASSSTRASGSGTGAFRPAGTATAQRRRSLAGHQPAWVNATDRPTSSVREVQEDHSDWADEPWHGRTFEQQVDVAHSRQQQQQQHQSSTVSPHFASPPLHHQQHFEHAALPAPPPPPPNYILGGFPGASDLDGRWTVPRVIALHGNPAGGLPGIWKDAGPDGVYDFKLDMPTRPVYSGMPLTSGKQVYKAPGEWITSQEEVEEVEEGSSGQITEGGEDTPMPEEAAKSPPTGILVDLDDDSTSTSEAAPAVPPKSPESPPPKRGFSTATLEELATHTRPHPHLYFSPSTFSWCLLAPLPPDRPETSLFGSAASPSSDAPELWEVRAILPERAESALLAANLSPGLPIPLPPADGAGLTAVSRGDWAPWTPATARAHLLELRGSKGGRALVSDPGWYPAVIEPQLWQALLEARGHEPAPGVSPEDSRWNAARFLWRLVDNLLFAGESRGVPLTGKTFQSSFPFDRLGRATLVDTLGFRVRNDTLCPPSVDERTPEGRAARQRLLRTWFEVGCWMEADERRRDLKQINRKTGSLRVEVRDPTERMAKALGGDNLARIPPSDGWQTVGTPFLNSASGNRDPRTGLDRNAKDYSMLGVTPDLADEVVERVYDLQIRAAETKTPLYLDALKRIAAARSSDLLQNKLVLEASLDHFTLSELNDAYKELHLPPPFDPTAVVPNEDALLSAFDARNNAVEHPGRRKVLLNAARMVAKHRKSELLEAVLQTMPDTGLDDGMELGEAGKLKVVKAKMEPARAYVALGADESTDDDMLLMIYPIRLDDATTDADKEKAREALEVIAEERKSDKLRAFLREGKKDSDDGWQAGPTVDPNVPVGLTNIANTCYLNSLLQYFFTVRELREAILSFDASAPTPTDGEGRPLPIRVGGRLVSEAEVKRSKRFIALLQNLYTQLIHSPVSAVTPETELAYLALVPSKEEETFHRDQTAAQTSAPAPSSAPPALSTADASSAPTQDVEVLKSPSGASVLGKRKNGAASATSPASTNTVDLVEDRLDDMVIDSQSAASPIPPPSPAPIGTDAEMADGEVPAETAEADEHRKTKRGRSTDVDLTHADDDVADAQKALAARRDEDEDVDMPALGRVEGPTLPPRPTITTTAAGASGREKELEMQVSSYMAFGRQNDVTECMDNVMFQVEAAMLASAGSNSEGGPADEARAKLLKRTFFGTLRQTLSFLDPSAVSDPIRTRTEPFSSLLVDVPPLSSSAAASKALQRDLYDALDAVFEAQEVELEGHRASKRVALAAGKDGGLPLLLQVQLQRVQYDRAKGEVFKSNAHLGFEDEIDVRRYVAAEEVGGEQERERREKTEELRAELGGVRRRLEGLLVAQEASGKIEPAPSLLRSTVEHFTSLAAFDTTTPTVASSHSSDTLTAPSVDPALASDPAASSSLPEDLTSLLTPELFAATSSAADEIEREIGELEKKAVEVRGEMKALWAAGAQGVQGESGETRYELAAVFIHRGTALSGHYYIYQRDSRNPERWLKYNDSLVMEVPREEVFKETTGDTNAYFLVYVRKDRLDAIESIKREVGDA